MATDSSTEDETSVQNEKILLKKVYLRLSFNKSKKSNFFSLSVSPFIYKNLFISMKSLTYSKRELQPGSSCFFKFDLHEDIFAQK